MDEAALRESFPGLFAPIRWGPVEASFALLGHLPPAQLIGNANIIPFVEDRVVVLRLADRRPELPGGTLEPGEGFLDAVRRELREEAGARMRSFTLIGAWRCVSAASEPYRPHLPHPNFYRVVGFGDIELVDPPTNPVGGEQVASVALLSVAKAAALFEQWHRPDLAALCRLSEIQRVKELSRIAPRTGQ